MTAIIPTTFWYAAAGPCRRQPATYVTAELGLALAAVLGREDR